MKTTTAKLLIPLLSMSAAAAQAGDVDAAQAVKVDVVDIDTATRIRPVLLVERTRITVIGEPHAIVAVLAGSSAGLGDSELAPVRVLLGGGPLGADGRLVLPVPPVGTDDGPLPKPILLQALQLRSDGRVGASPIAELLRRPASSAPELKLEHALGSGVDVQAELIATDSVPAQYHLHLAARVPTTGYQLRLAKRVDDGAHVALTYELTDPDPALHQLTVLETLRAMADLGAATRAVEVTIRRGSFAGEQKVRDAID